MEINGMTILKILLNLWKKMKSPKLKELNENNHEL